LTLVSLRILGAFAMALAGGLGVTGCTHVLIGPERYNDLYEKFGNLNKLLGWGHARVIENLLGKRPECPRALSDKFADARVIESALLQHGQQIQLEQRTKAESDFAVAAASILAREGFIDWLERQGKRLGVKLGRGVSASVKDTARQIAEQEGSEMFLAQFPTSPRGCARSLRLPPRREWR
jgi:ribonuclease HIII